MCFIYCVNIDTGLLVMQNIFCKLFTTKEGKI